MATHEASQIIDIRGVGAVWKVSIDRNKSKLTKKYILIIYVFVLSGNASADKNHWGGEFRDLRRNRFQLFEFLQLN